MFGDNFTTFWYRVVVEEDPEYTEGQELIIDVMGKWRESINYDIKRINIYGESADVVININQLDSTSNVRKFAKAYNKKYNSGAISSKDKKARAKLLEKYLTQNVKESSTKLELLLIKEKNEWVIDDNYAFDKAFINIYTSNLHRAMKEEFDYYDCSDCITDEGERITPIKIKLNKKIKNDFLDFVVEDVFFNKKTVGVGESHFTEITGDLRAIGIKTTISNNTNRYVTLGDSIGGIEAKFLFDDGSLFYTTFFTTSTGYDVMLPWEKTRVYIYATVPKKILNKFKTCKVFIGNTEGLNRDEDRTITATDCKYQYLLKIRNPEK